MANEITVTIADASIPEIYSAEALRARYSKGVIAKPGILLFKSEAVAKFGDFVDLTEIGSLTVNDVSDAGGVTNQATTQTQRQIQLNLWKECTWDIVDRASRQSVLDLKREFAIAAGAALAQQLDASVGGLYSSITSNVVGDTESPGAMSDDLLIGAIVKLDDRNVPFENRTFIFKPKARGELWKLDKYTLAYATGAAKGFQLTGQIAEPYGIPLVISTQVTATGGVAYNMLIHKECIGFAMQKNINVEQLARVDKATPLSADVLYGTNVLRENHGCLIRTAS